MYEKKLARLLWKVDFKEIKDVKDLLPGKKMVRVGSLNARMNPNGSNIVINNNNNNNGGGRKSDSVREKKNRAITYLPQAITI